MAAADEPLENLLAAYNLNGNADDSSGNDYHGVPTGITYTSPGPVYPQWGVFDGIDDISVINYAALNNLDVPFSLSCIVKKPATAGPAVVLAGALTTMFFSIQSSGVVTLGKSGTSQIDSTTMVADDTTTWIGCSYDGITAKFYLQGISGGTPAYADPGFVSGVKEIGNIAGFSFYFKDNMQQLLIYDSIKSDAFFSTIYNGGAGLDIFAEVSGFPFFFGGGHF